MKWRTYRSHKGPNVIEYGNFQVIPGATGNMLGALGNIMHRNRTTMGQAEPGAPLDPDPTPTPNDLAAKAPGAVLVGSGIALAGTIGGAFAGGYLARGAKWHTIVLGSIAGTVLGGVIGAYTGGAVATAIVSA